MAENRFFKGKVEEFKAMLDSLYQQAVLDPESPAARKYNDIKDSVVYISEGIEEVPTSLENFSGAVYAHGAIIAGAEIKWKEDISPEPVIS